MQSKLPRDKHAEHKLCPVEEGLKQLSEFRNKGRGSITCVRGFLWDQNCLQYNVLAPVGWCGFVCCSVLPEKLLIHHS